MSRRPELKRPPQVHYGDTAAVQYANNSRMLHIQREMADRAIELLSLPQDAPAYILDLGCGSGLSGEALSDAGYVWLGVDISHSMLSVAVERDVEGDLFQSDLGDGLYFREGVFDACVSISTLQWLTHCDTSHTKPKQRLAKLFNSLYKCLKRGARAVFQLYPTDAKQLELISECAMKAGFVVSMLVDYPNSSKAKKYYVILDAGSVKRLIPKALTMADACEQQQKQMYCAQEIDEDNPSFTNNEERIKMQQEVDPIQKQAIQSQFIHGDKNKKKSHLKYGSKKRGKDRFQDKEW
eukprot:CAMPEP_0202686700 /NCGR_PEP_ID=MMETSP1385-20130828/2457_1 /ASSEMBLY_ACC=CAM_ASM_000861 /TAXON_ID=933848 /ORGANISM="Elphidium margaritaceum" /LENGTH=294 /DNA_ID=CAMNT_0049341331 /DNA_START=30 /DNA_END=911 /DNA_ORIENTATION=-